MNVTMTPSLMQTRATRPRRFSMGIRLGASFATILVLFGAVLVVVLQALGQMAAAEREVAELDKAKHAGHRVAALVREQYIHQAHTIIEGNRSHIDHYQDIVTSTRKATEELSRFARSQKERDLASAIAVLVRKNHDDFMTATLAAIDRGERQEVIRLHAETELVVGSVARLVKELNGHFEEGSNAARALADAERRRVRFTVLGCFGAASVLAAVLGLLTTRSIARRVGALREGARRLGDGDLTRRISLEGSDELADLARSFDEMAARLDKHREELVRSQKLASIGRLCAGVAHEINGPLGIIVGYAKVIRKQGADDEALGAIEDEARQCQRIVQALLDMSRQDTPRFEPIELAQLARDGIERLRATGVLGTTRITVTIIGTSGHANVLAFGDEAKLRQVVLNVIRNAAEATPDGGAIEVQIRKTKRRAILAVVDHGTGITPEARSRLFEPFFTTKTRGTGLGLAIARAIVEAHRGEIRIATADGGGVRVEIDLEEARQDAVATFA